jgi:hypothetical protein
MWLLLFVFCLNALSLTTVTAMDNANSNDSDEEPFHECEVESFVVHHVQIEEFLLRNGLNLQKRLQKISALENQDDIQKALGKLKQDIFSVFVFAKNNLTEYFIKEKDDLEIIVSKLRFLNLNESKHQLLKKEIEENEKQFCSIIKKAWIDEEKILSSETFVKNYETLLEHMALMIQQFFNKHQTSLPTIHLMLERSRHDGRLMKIWIKNDDQTQYAVVPVQQDWQLTINDWQTRNGCKALFCFIIFSLLFEVIFLPKLLSL